MSVYVDLGKRYLLGSGFSLRCNRRRSCPSYQPARSTRGVPCGPNSLLIARNAGRKSRSSEKSAAISNSPVSAIRTRSTASHVSTSFSPITRPGFSRLPSARRDDSFGPSECKSKSSAYCRSGRNVCTRSDSSRHAWSRALEARNLAASRSRRGCPRYTRTSIKSSGGSFGYASLWRWQIASPSAHGRKWPSGSASAFSGAWPKNSLHAFRYAFS